MSSQLPESDGECSSMPDVQDVLVLFQTTPGLDAAVVAWSRYEASKGPGIKDLVEEEEPPYRNAIDAMRDGWQVIHFPQQMAPFNDRELDYVGYEFILQKIEEVLE